MAELRTEEEQVEALKNWWNENGKSLVVAVVVALGGVFGWKTWQQQQHDAAEAASIAYQNLLDSVVVVLGAQGEEGDVATSQHLASELKSNHGSSEYARFASLLMAKVAVEQKQYDQALTELDWILANEPSSEMKNVVKLRKARVYLALGKYDQGLSELSQVSGEEFKVSVAELKGDLLLASGKESDAREAYQQAVDGTPDLASRPLLNIKLEDLAVSDEG